MLCSISNSFGAPASGNKDSLKAKFDRVRKQTNDLALHGTPEMRQRALDSANGRLGKGMTRAHWDSVDAQNAAGREHLNDYQNNQLSSLHVKQLVVLILFILLGLVIMWRIFVEKNKLKLIAARKEESLSGSENSTYHKGEDHINGRLDTMETFRKAIKKEPKNPELYIQRGDFYVKDGLLTSAVDDYTKAIELNPASAQAYWGRHIVLKKLGRTASSDRDRVKALSLDPSLDLSALN